MPKAPKTKVAKAVIHPNSRQASKIVRQSHHEIRKQKSKSNTTIKQEQLRQKLQWFQEHMDPQKTSFTKHDLAVMVTDYLERFKEELEQINIINSVGNRKTKQHIARETAIRLTEEREKAEFEGVGMEVPDLINGKNLNYFRNWTGEIRYFPNIKLRKIRKSDLDKGTESHKDIEIASEKAEKLTDDDVLPDYVDEEGDKKDSEELPDYVEEDKKDSEELPDYVDEDIQDSDKLPDYVEESKKDSDELPDYAEEKNVSDGLPDYVDKD